jgi:hypothetical protein
MRPLRPVRRMGASRSLQEPSIPLINALMTDERGGRHPRDRRRHADGALPLTARATRPLASVPATSRSLSTRIADIRAGWPLPGSWPASPSTTSILCTNERVLIVEEAVADRLAKAMAKQGACFLDPRGRRRATSSSTTSASTPPGWRVGDRDRRPAAGIKVPEAPWRSSPRSTSWCPSKCWSRRSSARSWMVSVPTARRGIRTAMAALRITGSGHSAAIHSEDPQTIMEFAAAVPVLRVAVNVGNSLGSAGIETNLAPTMTIGTGFFGRSSVGENLQPVHLVNRTRIAYNADARVPMADFVGRDPWRPPPPWSRPTPSHPMPWIAWMPRRSCRARTPAAAPSTGPTSSATRSGG